MEARVKLDLQRFFKKFGGRRVTVKQLADELAISTKSAGRILAELEKIGLARRMSKRVYEIAPEEEARGRRV